MRIVPFKQVDVFTSIPFVGNPVAVVFGADGLDSADMQRLAAWTNLSETTFVLAPTRPDCAARVRIFTPRHELPFAGHPTIGSAHAALESGFVPRKKSLVQECGAGLIELSVEDDGRIFLKGPAPKIMRMGPPVPSVPLKPGTAVLKVDVGPVWVVGEMTDAAALAALQPEWAIGIGGFAERRLRAVLDSDGIDAALARRIRVGQILHPSPASPAANRGWSDAVDRMLAQHGVPMPQRQAA